MTAEGIFISFEGVDGVGKTTQAERLREYLQSLGREVVMTREPGGTGLGIALREMLLHGGEIGVRAEALLFAADRAQHVHEVIRPALERGAVVITDRYIDSSVAYQAGGRELSSEDIKRLSEWATDGLWPRRTYLLDMDPRLSHSRLAHDEDRMESAGDAFQRRTRQAFLDIAQRNESRCLVIDAGGSIDSVWDAIKSDMDTVLQSAESSQMQSGPFQTKLEFTNLEFSDTANGESA